MLPTPTLMEDRRIPNQNQQRTKKIESNLNAYTIQKMLPTPTAMDSTNATATMKSTQVKEGSMHSVTLNRAMALGMLPTPTTGEHKHGKSEKYWDNRIHKGRQEDLSMMLYKGMLPTPCASDFKGAYRPESMTSKDGTFHREERLMNIYLKTGQKYNSKTSQLNPRFVAEMMGFPPNWTELPFQNGEQNQSKDMGTP